MTLGAFVLSVASSLTAIVILYLLYLASAAFARREVARGECWWLPGANAFRFVIRNIPRERNLFDIRYRAWLRNVVPASEAMSVGTFLEIDLLEGARLILPGRQDLPVLCFRLEMAREGLKLLVTDKMGEVLHTHSLDDTSRVLVEFSARARTWRLFKHEITRLYEIPQFRTLKGERRNVYSDYLLPMQTSPERRMKSILEYADEVTVTI